MGGLCAGAIPQAPEIDISAEEIAGAITDAMEPIPQTILDNTAAYKLEVEKCANESDPQTEYKVEDTEMVLTKESTDEQVVAAATANAFATTARDAIKVDNLRNDKHTKKKRKRFYEKRFWHHFCFCCLFFSCLNVLCPCFEKKCGKERNKQLFVCVTFVIDAVWGVLEPKIDEQLNQVEGLPQRLKNTAKDKFREKTTDPACDKAIDEAYEKAKAKKEE